jgi:hypothetical protein
VGDARVDILTLDAGLTARLTAAAAAALNDAFGTSAFTEGLVSATQACIRASPADRTGETPDLQV